jgi:hypothetical protein
VEDLPDDTTGSVIVLELVDGLTLRQFLNKTKGTLYPKK